MASTSLVKIKLHKLHLPYMPDYRVIAFIRCQNFRTKYLALSYIRCVRRSPYWCWMMCVDKALQL